MAEPADLVAFADSNELALLRDVHDRDELLSFQARGTNHAELIRQVLRACSATEFVLNHKDKFDGWLYVADDGKLKRKFDVATGPYLLLLVTDPNVASALRATWPEHVGGTTFAFLSDTASAIQDDLLIQYIEARAGWRGRLVRHIETGAGGRAHRTHVTFKARANAFGLLQILPP